MAFDNVIVFPTGGTPDAFSAGGWRSIGEVAGEVVGDDAAPASARLAAVVAAGMPAVAKILSSVCENPLMALMTRRAEIAELINAPPADPDADLLDNDDLFEEETAIEETICNSVATTHADLISQVKMLAIMGDVYSWDESFDRLCESLEKGIFEMARQCQRVT